MNRLLATTVLACSLAAWGCAPPPLLGSDAGPAGDAAFAPPDAGSMPRDDAVSAGDTDTTEQTVPFGRVAELVRQKCARSGCHAGSSASGVGNFKVPSPDASDQAIAEALRDQPLEGEKGQLVEPGQPKSSGLYLYTSGDRQPRMPIGKKLETDQIELVRRWIASGAPYE